MPIKFACPQCKNVLTVENRWAGKAGKCPKCGSPLNVPSPGAAAMASGSSVAGGAEPAAKRSSPPAAGQPPRPQLAEVLNELTESDFNRLSPFQQVYAPPRSQATGHELLRRATEEEKKDRRTKKGEATVPAMLVCYSIHNVLQSLGTMFLAAWLWFSPETFQDHIESFIYGGAGVPTGIVIILFLAAIMMLVGASIPIKKTWAYCVAFASYLFFSVLYVASIFSRLHDRNVAISIGISLVLCLFLATYFIRPNCRSYYGLKGWTWPLISVGAGLLCGLLAAGMYSLAGVYTPMDPAEFANWIEISNPLTPLP